MLSSVAKAIDRAFAQRTVTVYWRNRFGTGQDRYYADKIKDGEILKGLKCLRAESFTREQYDAVLAELGEYGYGLTVMGEPEIDDERTPASVV